MFSYTALMLYKIVELVLGFHMGPGRGYILGFVSEQENRWKI